jgi:hypothetical protein
VGGGVGGGGVGGGGQGGGTQGGGTGGTGGGGRWTPVPQRPRPITIWMFRLISTRFVSMHTTIPDGPIRTFTPSPSHDGTGGTVFGWVSADLRAFLDARPGATGCTGLGTTEVGTTEVGTTDLRTTDLRTTERCDLGAAECATLGTGGSAGLGTAECTDLGAAECTGLVAGVGVAAAADPKTPTAMTPSIIVAPTRRVRAPRCSTVRTITITGSAGIPAGRS